MKLMYASINNRLIVRKPTERMTESGIVLSEEGNTAVFHLEVIDAPTSYSGLIGKTILAERRHVIEFSEGEKIGALKVEDVLAVKSE